MLPHDAIRHALCGRYEQLSDASASIVSPFTVPGDGQSLAAYVVACGDGLFRVTDDGDVLFNAATHGVELTTARRGAFKEVASSCGITLGDDGELFVLCHADEVAAGVASLIEAAGRIAFATVAQRPRPLSQFERLVGAALHQAFGARLARRPEAVGSSGHQLKFSFGLDLGKANGALIQVIGAKKGAVDWDNVYKQAGKFDDLQHNELLNIRRFSVLEPVAEGLDKAVVALHRTSRPVVYDGPGRLLDYLRAAA